MAFLPALPTMSLGRPGLYCLKHKLDQVALNGFKGVEVFYEDLETLAKATSPEPGNERLFQAARQIRAWCDDAGLVIINLQPFMHYEGLIDRREHAQRIEKLHLWFKLAKILHTDLIQIPSNIMLEGSTGDRDILVPDMVEVADLGLQETPIIRFAYENLCWGKHVDTWHAVWDIVVRVNRPNFGTCLDTLNIAGREWADPTSENGKIPNADKILGTSLERLRKTVDVKKVFFVQLVDAERLSLPLRQGHELYTGVQPARADWSRGARLFYSEPGGYLPIIEILRVITDESGLGYKGWISFELFSRTTADKAEDTPSWHAERARRSWEHLVEKMRWREMGLVPQLFFFQFSRMTSCPLPIQ